MEKVKENLEIKQGTAFISIPRDKKIIKTFRKVLEVYENEEDIKEIMTMPKIPEKEEEKEIEEEENDKVEEEQEVEIENTEIFKECPLCSGKLKRKKVRQEGDNLIQTIKCKKWGCKFKRDYIIKV